MKQPIDQLRNMRSLKSFFLALMLTLAISSCGDDEPTIDLDAPNINATEGIFVRGGQNENFTFSVIVPGSIASVSVTASAGTATITNEDELIGETSGLVRVTYETTENIKGTQTVTLSVTDDQGKSTEKAAEIEVFAPINYGMAIVSGAGDVNTTFIQGLINLDQSTIDNSNSTELAQFASIYSDGSAIYSAGFGAPATLGRYVFNSLGEAVLDQEIIVPGSNSFSSVEIVSQTVGYATVGGGLSRAIVFNPAEMRITGEIDLSSAGSGLFYSDIIASGDNLFIALNDFGGSGEAKVAVIDLTTNTLTKVISDDRTATLFGTLTSSIMVKDTNGDIYVQGSGLFSGKNSGILRIKSGETEFDADYFFDLTTKVGGSCFGLYQFSNGQAMTAVSENDDNWFGFDGDNPSFRYRKIDLANTTDQGDLDASLPNTFAASRTMFFSQISTDEVLFPIAGSDEDAVYSFTLGTGAVTKKMTSTSGYVTGLIPVQ